MRYQKKEILFFFFTSSLTLIMGLIFLEFFWIPYQGALPRETLLMGFAATPKSRIDDITINSMGFTGDSLELKKPNGTIRVLTLGGSTMFNHQMTERLKTRFKKSINKPMEILGAALRRHTSRSSLLKYKLLSKYQFDYVIIYEGINDLWANNVVPKDFKEDYSHLDPEYKRNFYLDHSLLLRLLYNKWIISRNHLFYSYFFPTLKNENNSKFLSEKTFHQNILILIDEIRNHHGQPILMTFAWNIPQNYSKIDFENYKLGYNNPNHYDSQSVEVWGSPGYVREGLQRLNNIVRQLAKEKGVLLIDQEQLMGKELRWYGDVCHFSEEGTDKFIDNIVDFFLTNNLLAKKDVYILDSTSNNSLPSTGPRGDIL